MQSLIHKSPNFHLSSPLQSSVFFLSTKYKNHNFFRIHPSDARSTFTNLTLCSSTAPQSLDYGGWDAFQLADASVNSGESNQLRNFLNSIGIGDKKYVFVYLFGFVCALAFSRVKISSIIIFPTCAVVFALGFSVGLVKGGDIREVKLNGNRRQVIDETFRGFVEKLRGFGDNLKGDNAKLLKLKNDIKEGIECNRISVRDLEGYIDVLESTDVSFWNSIDSVEKYLQSVLVGSREGSFDYESSKDAKKIIDNGLNVSKYFDGLFGKKSDGPRNGKIKESNKMEMVDGEINNQKGENILAASLGERDLNFPPNQNMDNKEMRLPDGSFDDNVKSRTRAESFIDEAVMENFIGENVNRNANEEIYIGKAAFDQRIHNNWNNTSRFVKDREVYLEQNEEETETMTSQNGLYDSVNFSITMNRVKNTASSRLHQKYENLNRNYSHFEKTEDYLSESYLNGSQRYSLKNEMFSQEKLPFDDQEIMDDNVSNSSPSSILSDDLEFNRYLAEANKILKEAKTRLRQQANDVSTEHALQKAAVLFSNAIEVRPTSSLAVCQLAETYLLHGELKLGISRKLRSRLARTFPPSVEKRKNRLDGFDGELAIKDNMLSALADVCEECEELLVKAGRKYKLAFLIDRNDLRTLYNWGLTLSYRAQLIADIGPSAAADADKIFLAAIEKFDAIMSKSNDYAPDALFRWGAALHYRSQLRPRRSREKFKLLQQAKRLYEDALRMDSRNRQLQKAFSSCVSELEYWYS